MVPLFRPFPDLLPAAAQGKVSLNDLSDKVPDVVMRLLTALALLMVVWFVFKAQARRGRAVALYQRLDPTVQVGKLWFAAAPATFVYMAIWTVTTILQQGTPETLNSVMTRWLSTNIAGLATEPIRVLFSSAFVVAENGFGFTGYVLVYVLITVRLEHRIGAARLLLVAGFAHVVGSLLTVAVEVWAIENGYAPRALAVTVDVGVSYVMVGSVGAYLWLVSRRWLPWLAAGLALGVVLPMFISRTIWDLGHFMATCLGIAAGWVAVRYPLREPIRWGARRAAYRPRPLATFPGEPRPWPTLDPADEPTSSTPG